MNHWFFKTCPHCGANLDPDETCECQNYRNLINELLDRMTPQQVRYTYELANKVICRPDWWHIA